MHTKVRPQACIRSCSLLLIDDTITVRASAYTYITTAQDSRRTHPRMSEMSFLNAYSQPYILITLIPEITWFMIFTRLSVYRALLNLRQQASSQKVWHRASVTSPGAVHIPPHPTHLSLAYSLPTRYCRGICRRSSPIPGRQLGPRPT